MCVCVSENYINEVFYKNITSSLSVWDCERLYKDLVVDNSDVDINPLWLFVKWRDKWWVFSSDVSDILWVEFEWVTWSGTFKGCVP